MNFLVLIISVGSLIGSGYFFFFEKSLLFGSILIVSCVFFAITYAMLSTVNKLPDEKK